jgi:hypothetical protein
MTAKTRINREEKTIAAKSNYTAKPKNFAASIFHFNVFGTNLGERCLRFPSEC